jgi:hypothetical protein
MNTSQSSDAISTMTSNSGTINRKMMILISHQLKTTIPNFLRMDGNDIMPTWCPISSDYSWSHQELFWLHVFPTKWIPFHKTLGLYIYNPFNNPNNQNGNYQFISTDEENKFLYTSRQFKRAKKQGKYIMHLERHCEKTLNQSFKWILYKTIL